MAWDCLFGFSEKAVVKINKKREAITMSVPKCCGTEMAMNAETNRFVEVQCRLCGDVVFVKKADTEKPQMLDD